MEVGLRPAQVGGERTEGLRLHYCFGLLRREAGGADKSGPPVGVRLTTDVEPRVDGFRARVRWTDPLTKKRVGRVSHVRTAEEVEEFFDQMRKATETGTNTAVTLAAYAASIGDRWKRGLDPTSTAEN